MVISKTLKNVGFLLVLFCILMVPIEGRSDKLTVLSQYLLFACFSGLNEFGHYHTSQKKHTSTAKQIRKDQTKIERDERHCWA